MSTLASQTVAQYSGPAFPSSQAGPPRHGSTVEHQSTAIYSIHLCELQLLLSTHHGRSRTFEITERPCAPCAIDVR